MYKGSYSFVNDQEFSISNSINEPSKNTLLQTDFKKFSAQCLIGFMRRIFLIRLSPKPKSESPNVVMCTPKISGFNLVSSGIHIAISYSAFSVLINSKAF